MWHIRWLYAFDAQQFNAARVESEKMPTKRKWRRMTEPLIFTHKCIINARKWRDLNAIGHIWFASFLCCRLVILATCCVLSKEMRKKFSFPLFIKWKSILASMIMFLMKLPYQFGYIVIISCESWICICVKNRFISSQSCQSQCYTLRRCWRCSVFSAPLKKFACALMFIVWYNLVAMNSLINECYKI